MSKKPKPSVFIKAGLSTAISHPAILFPYAIIAFCQLLILEVIFFAPRYPLNTIFGNIIGRLHGEIHLHYPFNFLLLNTWFQVTQIPIYVLLNTFCIGASVLVIQKINDDVPFRWRQIFGETFRKVPHLLTVGLLSIGLLMGGNHLLNMAIIRATQIRSTTGKFYILKRIVLDGGPYYKLMLAVFVTALLIYLIPLIMIEGKKVFSALFENLKLVFTSFWFTIAVVFIPALLYIPVLFIKTNASLMAEAKIPELWIVVTIVGIFTALFIDAVQYTSISIYYLSKKESS